MTVDHAVRIVAGFLILLSLALYYLVSPYWLLLTAFVGLNLIQSALTKFCPAEMVLKKLFFSKPKSDSPATHVHA